MPGRLTFLVLEDEPIIARQLKATLGPLGDVRLADTRDGGLAILGDPRAWNGFWIDVMLDKGCGLDVLEAAREGGARAPAFVASANLEDNEILTRIFHLNAVPVPKPFRDDAIARFVRAVEEHRASEAEFEQNLAARTEVWRAEAGLTEREAEILARRARGESRECIAQAMGVTALTLKKQISNAMHKLKAADGLEPDLDAAVVRLLREVASR